MTGYRVYRTTSVAANVLLGTVPAARLWFLDKTAPSGTIRYTVSAVNEQGLESRLGVSAEVNGVPGGATVRFSPQGDSWALRIADPEGPADGPRPVPTAAIYDVHGRLVARIPVHRAGGGWEAAWDGRQGGGNRLPRGIFFLRVRQGTRAEVRKILLR